MSADFWAGYGSGVIGICVGNPLDVLKVRLQAGHRVPIFSFDRIKTQHAATLFKGVAAPIVAYGTLNSLLYMTYNRSLKALDSSIVDPTKLHHVSLPKIGFAGAVGGLATWVVSAPSELIKCRTQLREEAKATSLVTFKQVWRSQGVQGLYLGGLVTSFRDMIGYGFYFSSYEMCRRFLAVDDSAESSAADFDVLVSGGIAGVATWVSIYPLDLIKTRIQAEGWEVNRQRSGRSLESGTIAVTRTIYAGAGFSAFFRGLTVCSVRAFFVNAIQWYTYEKIMALFSADNTRGTPPSEDVKPYATA